MLSVSVSSLVAQDIDSTSIPPATAAHGPGVGLAMRQVAADAVDEVLRPRGLQGTGYAPGAPAARVYPHALGTNLSPVVDWSSALPFSNLFKLSRTWLTQCSQWSDPPDPGCTGQWNTEEAELLSLDEHGWVKSLPAPGDPPIFTRATAYWALYPEFPSGRYVVSYEGEGSIEYGLGASLQEELSAPGRHVIRIDPEAGMTLSITRTDPKGTGDYIRNIQVVREGLVPRARTGRLPLFDPRFVDRIEPFQAVRFMDWMRTNDQPPGTWSERPRLDDARWTEDGVPLEAMLTLSDETSADPWITVPHTADDELVRRMAETVRDGLDANLKVYVEHSNEVWNGIFSQHTDAKARARAAWPDAEADDFTLALNWHGRRTAEVCSIWKQVFAAEVGRVVCVLGAQSANTYVAEQALRCPLWEQAPCVDHGLDAIAIAPYFGAYLSAPEAVPDVQAWTRLSDGGLDALFQELEQGGLVRNSPGGVLSAQAKEVTAHRKLADRHGLSLLAYEGGQHMASVFGSLDRSVVDLFTAANRDPRMGRIYRRYLAMWQGRGGQLFMNFTDIQRPGRYGSWGALEHIGQASSPKYDALLDYLGTRPL
jgi:hypothetical protein